MSSKLGRANRSCRRISAIQAPKRKLLALLIMLAFPATQTQQVYAEAVQDNPLPDFGQQPVAGGAIIRPGGNGVTLENTYAGKKIVVAPEYSNQNGIGIAAALAALVGEQAAVGVLVSAGSNKKELLLNAGYQPDANNRFILSVGQLRQFFDIAFTSGMDKAEMTQNSGGLGYQLYLGRELLNYLELNGYLADTPSRDLADKTFAVDTATLYELWNDRRRIAGGRVAGLQGKLALTPLPGGTVKLSFGSERLSYDYLAGAESVTRLTGGAEWRQALGNGYTLTLGGNTFAAQNRYTLGLAHSTPGGGQFGIGLTAIQGRDGTRSDTLLQLSYSATFGGKAGGLRRSTPNAVNPAAAPAWGSLLDQVALRPAYLPLQAIAKRDTTATPVRLIAVDKTALPSNATVDPVTGNVTAALPVAVSAIAGVTRNGAPFANSGQFSLNNGALIINPKLIEQPAAGVRDTYIVTVNNAAGGTTLVTVVVSHGSVKIDSISVAAGDITPPTISGLAVGNVAALTATLAATLNEAGTGYYVVLPASSAVPSASQVKSGQDAGGGAAEIKGSSAMAANTSASIAIAGLTPATSYKVHFAAIDSANNLQAAVSSASFTTVPADTTPDAFDISDMAGQPVATAITTNAVTVAGINVPVSAATSIGTLVKNGVDTKAATVSVSSGDTLAVRLTTGATVTSPPVTGTLTIGTVSDGFSISTAAIDTIPDAFSFTAQSSIAQNSKVESNAITVSGINAASPISVSGGEYQVNGGAWASTAGTVSNGSTVKVRHTSAVGYGATTQTTLTIGGVAGVFASTTVAAPVAPPSDTTPDAFAFVDQTNVALSTLTESAAITVAGIDAAAAISVSGGEYQIDGGAWTAAAGTVSNGQTVKVRHTSSGSNSTATNTTLTIGGVSDTFTTTTVASAEVPPVMGDVPNQAGTEGVAFNLATAGYVTATNGDSIDSYRIASGSLPPGLSMNTGTGVISGTPTTTGTYDITIQAHDNDGWSNSDAIQFVIAAADTTPNTFDFTNMTNQALSTAVTTNTITVADINTTVTASTSVGTLVKNGVDTGSSSTSVAVGDSLAVKLTTSGSYSTAINGTVTIGTGATNTDNFSIITMNIPAPTGVAISVSTLSWNSVGGGE